LASQQQEKRLNTGTYCSQGRRRKNLNMVILTLVASEDGFQRE